MNVCIAIENFLIIYCEPLTFLLQVDNIKLKLYNQN